MGGKPHPKNHSFIFRVSSAITDLDEVKYLREFFVKGGAVNPVLSLTWEPLDLNRI